MNVRTAQHYEGTAALAVNAGVDMAMLPSTDDGKFSAALLQAVKDGKVSTKRVDQRGPVPPARRALDQGQEFSSSV